jgi:hypothetical protein
MTGSLSSNQTRNVSFAKETSGTRQSVEGAHLDRRCFSENLCADFDTIRVMSEPNIYKIFKTSTTPEVWVCTICPRFEIQINPRKYNKLNSGQKRRALETEADKHMVKQHSKS